MPLLVKRKLKKWTESIKGFIFGPINVEPGVIIWFETSQTKGANKVSLCEDIIESSDSFETVNSLVKR